MQVHDDLEAVVTRPADGLLEEGQLALDEGFARPDLERPITNWNTNMVQASRVFFSSV